MAGASKLASGTFGVKVCDSGLINVALVSKENDAAEVDGKEGVEDSDKDKSDD